MREQRLMLDNPANVNCNATREDSLDNMEGLTGARDVPTLYRDDSESLQHIVIYLRKLLSDSWASLSTELTTCETSTPQRLDQDALEGGRSSWSDSCSKICVGYSTQVGFNHCGTLR